MNDKRFEKTVDAIRKAPAIQRPKMVDGLVYEETNPTRKQTCGARFVASVSI